jgi:hypothetical protein
MDEIHNTLAKFARIQGSTSYVRNTRSLPCRFVFGVTALFPLIVSGAALLIDEQPILAAPPSLASSSGDYPTSSDPSRSQGQKDSNISLGVGAQSSAQPSSPVALGTQQVKNGQGFARMHRIRIKALFVPLVYVY